MKTAYDWEKQNYYEKFDCSLKTVKDTLERVDAFKVSKQTFIDQYERPGRPGVIVNDQDGWQAQTKWTADVSIGQNVARTASREYELLLNNFQIKNTFVPILD